MRRSALVIGLAALLLPLACRADFNCPELFQRDAIPGKAYVLAFVGGSGVAPSEKAAREDKLALLQSRATPQVQQYLDDLAQGLDTQPPFDLVFLACDFRMEPDRFTRSDLDTLWRRNVLGLLWTSQESGKAAVVHLSVPYYQHRARVTSTRGVEVAWLHAAQPAVGIDDWILEMDKDRVANQALLAVGIGFAALNGPKPHLALAKLSFCRVRSFLGLVAREAVRPAARALEADLGALVADALKEIEARSAGTPQASLHTSALKVTCNQ